MHRGKRGYLHLQSYWILPMIFFTISYMACSSSSIFRQRYLRKSRIPQRVIRPRIKRNGIQLLTDMYLLDASRFISDTASPQRQFSLPATPACLELNPSSSFCSPAQLHPAKPLVLTPPAAEQHVWMWKRWSEGLITEVFSPPSEISAQPQGFNSL